MGSPKLMGHILIEARSEASHGTLGPFNSQSPSPKSSCHTRLSDKEQWKLMVLPYLEIPLVNQVFTNSEPVGSQDGSPLSKKATPQLLEHQGQDRSRPQ